tara:strand:- start:371 stop:499 length:129 start_codon:yes stop_codon:yes gene_type:complete
MSPKNKGDGLTEIFNLGKKHLIHELKENIVNIIGGKKNKIKK